MLSPQCLLWQVWLDVIGDQGGQGVRSDQGGHGGYGGQGCHCQGGQGGQGRVDIYGQGDQVGIMAQDYVHILLRVQAAPVFAIWGIPVS